MFAKAQPRIICAADFSCAFDEAKTDAEREKITQAARWGLAALDNREEVVRHDD